jgi:outer membrane lipoprotein-sorting protein
LTRSVLFAAVCLAGCKPQAPQGSMLLSQVKQALADRDARLGSYHLVAETTEGEEHVTHGFFFRSPNKMRAVVSSAPQFEWSFDGKRLYRLHPGTKSFETFELKLPQEKAAMYLHHLFSAFVLEGFRTPLMPMKGVTATLVSHPKGPQAVELKLEPGEGVSVTYVLRWPSADFLERRGQSDAGTSALKIEDEHCDDTLKLCVPKRAEEYVDGKRVLTIQLTAVELNVEVPADDFAPQVPPGWTAQTRQVVDE